MKTKKIMNIVSNNPEMRKFAEKRMHMNNPLVNLHMNAWTSFRCPVKHLLLGLVQQAEDHKRRYETDIANDSVLGEAWLDIFRGVESLLNGELNGLDAGTILGLMTEILAFAGFPEM